MTEQVTEEVVKDPQALLTAYNNLKADLAKLREEHTTLQGKLESLNGDEFRLKALSAEAKLALQNQGIKDADRLMKYVGTDGLDFDEKGGVTGLNERLETLKKDLPEIFDPKVRAGGKGDIFADTATEVKQDPLKAAVHKALHG